ncbi:28S ribosomal protein L42, mitochondrial [Toxocara canis]|uniref:Large ribosomal subunit protein mL42 n=1 Tax=Toxocara canis TaxID=6265 RepID=A0A0B2UWN2_TOXCA|nr:28S ribosomal protein L42, mitochondrial [Toxocara canis]
MLSRLARFNAISCCRRWLRSSVTFPSSSEAVVVEEDVDFTKPHTVVCKNGVVACWHPDEPFPYEHTRPIDVQQLKKEKAALVSSVLKQEVVLESERNRLRRGPDNSELKEIFYTTKHEWYSRTREDRLHAVGAPLPKRK